jgi:hypothetical protein
MNSGAARTSNMTAKTTTSAPRAPTETNLEIVRLVIMRFAQKESCRTTELTRPRGSANFNLQKLHAKHTSAGRVQRFVIWRRSLVCVWRKEFYVIEGAAYFNNERTISEI